MTRIRFNGSPRSFRRSPDVGIGAFKEAVSQLLIGAPLGTVTNVDRCDGLSTLPDINELERRLGVGVDGASRATMPRRSRLQGRLRIAETVEHAATRVSQPLPLCYIVIAGRIIMHGPRVVAIGGAVGPGEVFHSVGQVGVGIAQA